MNELRKVWWVALLKGVILLLLSIYVFRYPLDALVGVAFYIGISLLITGIFQAGISVSTRNVDANWGWALAGGLIDILFGFVLLSNPVLTASTLPFVVGFWIIVSGIMSFVNAFQYKKEGFPMWWLGLLGGLLSMLIGYMITNDLAAGMLVITAWMAIGFALAGIVNIIIGVKIKNA